MLNILVVIGLLCFAVAGWRSTARGIFLVLLLTSVAWVLLYCMGYFHH